MTEPRTISGRAIVLFLAVLLAVGLMFNWYNHREQDRNADRLTDDFLEQVDP